MPKQLVFLSDIDGSILDTSARSKLAKAALNFDKVFHNADNLHLDVPVHGAKACLQRIAKKYDIVYLTGRRNTLKEATREQLAQHGFPPGEIITRSGHNRLSRDVHSGNFKLEAAEMLARKGVRAVCGAGDNAGDIEAVEALGGYGVALDPKQEYPCRRILRVCKLT